MFLLARILDCNGCYHNQNHHWRAPRTKISKVFLMTVTSGIPPTDQTPILSIALSSISHFWKFPSVFAFSRSLKIQNTVLHENWEYVPWSMMMAGMYYATVMVLTTAATVLGVMVLRIHHQVRYPRLIWVENMFLYPRWSTISSHCS